MDPNLSDKEQIEVVKKWLKEYGIGLLLAIVVGTGLGYGWRAYKAHQQTVAVAAANQYEVMALLADADQLAMAKQRANQVIDEHGDTIYAIMARFMLAKVAVQQGQFSDAIDPLRYNVTHAPSVGFKQLARIRLARVYLQMHQFTKASSVLATLDDPTFSPSVLQLKGDLATAKGDQTGAMKWYRQAKVAYSKLDITDPILEMKLAG